MATVVRANILLRLNKELDAQITSEARKLGISKNSYVVLLLQEQVNRPKPDPAA